MSTTLDQDKGTAGQLGEPFAHAMRADLVIGAMDDQHRTSDPSAQFFDHFAGFPISTRDVLVFVEHQTRKLHVAGVTANPTGAWVARQARNLMMDLDDAGYRLRFAHRTPPVPRMSAETHERGCDRGEVTERRRCIEDSPGLRASLARARNRLRQW